jgi:hypothetical protein
MKERYRWGGLLALGMMVLLLLSACSGTGSQTGNTDTGKINSGTQSNKTPQQLLESSIIAMKQLKTTHFEMTTVTQTSGAASHQGSGMNLKDSGDQAFPDELSMHLTINSAGASQRVNLAEVVKGQKVYIQNPKGKWYMLDNAAIEAGANPLAGANVSNYNNLLNLAEKQAKLTDHSSETINGATVRHISANFDNLVLQDLLTATGQFNGLSVQERTKVENALKNAKLEKPTLHLWIDEATSYVRRMELKFVMNVDNSATATTSKAGSASNTPSVMSTSVDTTIDYSKFNLPVKIAAPTSATMTTNVAQIFQ